MIYGKCECGGDIVEIKINYYRKFHKKVYFFEDVPVGICKECGERVFKGEVLERLEEMSHNTGCINREINVPVCKYV